MSGKKGMVHYDVKTKQKAIELRERGMTYEEIANELGLRQAMRIKVWVNQYKKEGVAGLTKKGSGRPRKQSLTQEAYIAKLEMENELLKKFHTELRKLTTVRRDIGSLNTTEEDIP